jgi:RimJ/RimL family protein N-acetyltransferase
MTIMVDECQWPFRGRLWCHLVSDASFDELHGFVRRLGKPRVAFQGDHYDLDEADRARAVAMGAEAVDGRELVRRLRACGLRRGPALSRNGLAGVAHLDAPELTTRRLRLRQWTEADRPKFHEMSADPEVIGFHTGARRAAAAESIDARAVGLALRGLGRWAVDRLDTGEFIGTVGLGYARFEAPFTPAIDIGWRLARRHWGQGFALEAAGASLVYGFDVLELRQIVAFTSTRNRRSRAVMERLGMVRSSVDDFEHPDHPLDDEDRLQVLYRATP